MSQIMKAELMPQRLTRQQGRTASRALERLRTDAVIRSGEANAAGIVRQEHMGVIDRVVRDAMVGQAMLQQTAAALAGDNLLLYDDLQMLVATARIGKMQVIADMIDGFCENR